MTTLVLLLAAFAAAVEPQAQHPRCPQGALPVFTGQPFRPFTCAPDGKETPRKPVEPAEDGLPAKGGWSAALKGLDGRWRGIVYFAGTRYEVTLEVSGSGARWKFWPKDYATHIAFPTEAEIKKPGWFSGGKPGLSVWSPSQPGKRLGARFWLGANPAADDQGRPRAAVWRLDGRPELHRVEYAVADGRLSGSYTLTDPDRGPIGASFDLSRIGED